VPPISRGCLCAHTSHISNSADMPVIRRGGKSCFTMPTSLFSSQKCSSTTFSPRTPRRLAARTAFRITSTVHRALIYKSREGPQQQLNGSALTPFPTLLFPRRSSSVGESSVSAGPPRTETIFRRTRFSSVPVVFLHRAKNVYFSFAFSLALSCSLSLLLSLSTHTWRIISCYGIPLTRSRNLRTFINTVADQKFHSHCSHTLSLSPTLSIIL